MHRLTIRLTIQLYEGRGEWAVCETCPLHLLCYMKRPLYDARWCAHCDGWVLDDNQLIVRCAGYHPTPTSHEHAEGQQHCANCNRLDDRFGTYETIERKIAVYQGDPAYLKQKHPDFAKPPGGKKNG